MTGAVHVEHFGYDARSRLISASDLVFTNNECQLDLIVSNRYDYIGRRVKKITRDSEITFFYDERDIAVFL